MTEAEKYKTVFKTATGLYEFNRMPFGLITAPSTFELAMDAILGFLKGRACMVYFDDVLIVGATWEEHLRNLGQVLTVLFKAGFRLNMKKR